MMTFLIKITHRGKTYAPAVLDGAVWTTERKGTPGKLTFTVIKDQDLDFHEGNTVTLDIDGVPVFFGYVFSKRRDKQHHIQVTAYDQLRYLMNKDTYVYEDKTASEVLELLAADFGLVTGSIADTKFKIASRVEDNATLLDTIYNALDLTIMSTGWMYVLYDEYGKLTLKALDDMYLNLLIDAETAENFDYTSTIDDNTYNKIKLSYENEGTGKRDIYIVQDGKHIGDWGVLQYFDSLQKGENGEAKAEALLKLYNAITRKLRISNEFGDLRVRAGSLIPVKLGLGDVNVANYMLVEKCEHQFRESEHTMNLTLKGGEFDG
jgi:hypothetical protein